MYPIPIISFRYYGKYGHFRKPYSNVSSLSYPFPPRTAIAGLLGAILGVPKEEVTTKFDDNNLNVAVLIDGAITTTTHVTNLRQDGSGGIDYLIKRPKKNWKPAKLKNIPEWNKATQIPMELLRNPSFILYVNLKYDMEELISRIKNERYYYTPSIGLSEFFARLEYISYGLAMPLSPGDYDISTVIPKEDCTLTFEHLRPDEGHQIQELKVPYSVTSDRRFILKDYLINMLPKSLPVQMQRSPYKFEDKIITFL